MKRLKKKGMAYMTTKSSATYASSELQPLPPVAGHSVQQDESQHTFLIDQKIIACTPVEYRLLALLLSQADRCVSYAQLIAQFQEGPLTDARMFKQARIKVIHLISDLRSKLWSLGLDVVCVMNVGYILLSSGTENTLSLEKNERVDQKEVE
jgi:DNA-binding response OmpR family regulator